MTCCATAVLLLLVLYVFTSATMTGRGKKLAESRQSKTYLFIYLADYVLPTILKET